MRLNKCLWGATLLAVLTACTSNPTQPVHDDEGETLDVTLSISSEHVATLTEANVSVEVKDHDGVAMMDFEAVVFEYRLEGTTEWTGTPMTASGTAFAAPVTFFTSGEYELRVSGQPHGGVMGVMYDRHDHLEVERAHAEVANMRVEFETFPGDLHEGAEGALRFWVLEKDADVNGVRHPIAGLTAAIHCEEEAGFSEEHMAHEEEPGVYEAHHTFVEAGGFHVGIHLTDSSGNPFEVEFNTHVSHAH